jgi:hypothetical protein
MFFVGIDWSEQQAASRWPWRRGLDPRTSPEPADLDA